EAHARPALPIEPDRVVLNVNILTEETGTSSDLLTATLAWAERNGFTDTGARVKEVLLARDDLVVKWEAHTEFISITISAPSSQNELAERMLDSLLASHGETGQDGTGQDGTGQGETSQREIGQLISKCHIDIKTRSDQGPEAAHEDTHPNPSTAVRVWLNGRAHMLETDLLHDDDDFVRYRLEVTRRQGERIGRLVQRLVEIETYRNLAYLAVPMLHTTGPQVGELDRKIDAIAEQSTRDLSPDDEAEILGALTGLSAQLQNLGSKAEFRFSAAMAYANIVSERLDELREERIEGHQRLSTAVQRRLRPNIRSCVALQARIDRVSQRVSNITELLRTRVELTLQEQNTVVLRSIDRRTKDQLRLQQIVEGLSVAAISYYVISILVYFMQGIEKLTGTSFYLPAMIVLVPAVFGSIFYLSRRLREKHLTEDQSGTA
ncbi:MAG: DUF3422 domain-containing protein, partial [Pseudomonadota bacterium]